MDSVELAPQALDLTEYVKRTALERDYKELYTRETLFTFQGEPFLYYGFLDGDCSDLVRTLQRIEYQTSTRTGGLKTVSRVFGYQPRVALRRDFCSATSLSTQDPEANALMLSYGKQLTARYRATFPAVYEKQATAVRERVRPEWAMPETVFTSGIINKNNPLKYHFDAGNFKGVCSCMIGFKRDVAGGYLSIPEFNIALEIGDRSISIFDGQSLLHGVTPIRKLSPMAYRYTAVYYALEQMWKCEPLELELARIRNLKTAREIKRANSVVVDQHGARDTD